MDIDVQYTYSVKVIQHQRIGAITEWILSYVGVEKILPFLSKFHTRTEQRNELVRRMLRISDDPSIPPPDVQTGMFWLETLAADEQVQNEDAVQDLCQHFGGIGITEWGNS